MVSAQVSATQRGKGPKQFSRPGERAAERTRDFTFQHRAAGVAQYLFSFWKSRGRCQNRAVRRETDTQDRGPGKRYDARRTARAGHRGDAVKVEIVGR